MQENRTGGLKVLIVDDSRLTREIVKDMLAADPAISEVHEAENGQIALDKVHLIKPDFIIMDIVMPVMDGITATENIMAERPTPIMILSSSVSDEEVSNAFSAIQRGALEIMEKPKGIISKETFAKIRNEVLEKIKFLSRIKVITHPRRKLRPEGVPRPLYRALGKIVAIGASTGGPKAVLSILKELPNEFPSPILVAQHITPGFSAGFAEWLRRETFLNVISPSDNEKIVKGTVYIAPTEMHMAVEGDRIKFVDLPPISGIRPSVDILFSSVAKNYNEKAICVLLTGMGKDGAKGAKEIKERGGFTIAQDEKSSVIYGMPRAAIEMNAIHSVLPLSKIPEELIKLVSYQHEGVAR